VEEREISESPLLHDPHAHSPTLESIVEERVG